MHDSSVTLWYLYEAFAFLFFLGFSSDSFSAYGGTLFAMLVSMLCVSYLAPTLSIARRHKLCAFVFYFLRVSDRHLGVLAGKYGSYCSRYAQCCQYTYPKAQAPLPPAPLRRLLPKLSLAGVQRDAHEEPKGAQGGPRGIQRGSQGGQRRAIWSPRGA